MCHRYKLKETKFYCTQARESRKKETIVLNITVTKVCNSEVVNLQMTTGNDRARVQSRLKRSEQKGIL
jgi:hypothetical protein